MFSKIQDVLFSPLETVSFKKVLPWLALCIVVSLTFSCLGLMQAFNGQYVIQDDARQHVIFLERFSDPQLFSNDLLADYYKSVAPPVFQMVYWIAAKIGVSAVLFSKFLPSILSLIITVFIFLFTLRLLPIPFAATLSTVIFLQDIWSKDDLPCGAARSFYYPLLLSFLYFLSAGRLIPVLCILALQATIYPSVFVFSMAIIYSRIFKLERWKISISKDRDVYKLILFSTLIGGISLLPFALSSGQFGPTITAHEALQDPVFFPGGRERFYGNDLFKFLVTGVNCGMLPMAHPPALTTWLGLLFPAVMLFGSKLQLTKHLKYRRLELIARLLLVGISMFCVAHIVAFKLYLPGRFTEPIIRLVLPILAGISLSCLLQPLFQIASDRTASLVGKLMKPFALAATAAAFAAILAYPFTERRFPDCCYVYGDQTKLYEYLSSKPKSTVVATISPESANIPSFTKRSVLVSVEHALPFQKGYYAEIKERGRDLMAAQYSEDIKDVQAFNKKYGVTHWLIEKTAFEPDYFNFNRQSWWKGCIEPAYSNIEPKLENGTTFAMQKAIPTCSELETEKYYVLSSDKINKLNSSISTASTVGSLQ